MNLPTPLPPTLAAALVALSLVVPAPAASAAVAITAPGPDPSRTHDSRIPEQLARPDPSRTHDSRIPEPLARPDLPIPPVRSSETCARRSTPWGPWEEIGELIGGGSPAESVWPGHLSGR
ncbi:MAG: hypothetical protein MUD13_07820 [Candidatus Nanopelagicales bacterium]|jgi:hypothetical protein|nr:hypothetical protein [Candidatus Nanopelagicales bacterium]